MVFKIVNFFVELGIGVFLGIAAFVFTIVVMVKGVKNYYEDSRLPHNDASYVVRSHQICEDLHSWLRNDFYQAGSGDERLQSGTRTPVSGNIQDLDQRTRE